MPRRYYRRKGDAFLVGLLAVVVLVIIIIKIMLSLLAGFLIGMGIRRYYKWHRGRLAAYNNDSGLFWSKELKQVLARLLAIVLGIAGCCLLPTMFWAGVPVILLALFVYPDIRNWCLLQAGSRAKYASYMIVGVLILSSIIAAGSYESMPAAVTAQKAAPKPIDRERELAAAQRAMARKKEAHTWLNAADKWIGQQRYKQAIAAIDSALALAPDNDTARYLKARIHQAQGRYIETIAVLNDITSISSEGRMLRAKCLMKTGQEKAALADLKLVAATGSAEASRLYNKVNPLVRRVSGYITRCCDGTTSFARGRGACSHHGGVCDWNEPIYDEHRKYEDE